MALRMMLADANSTEHDRALRQLLMDNPMPGWVTLAMTREPNYFAGMQRFGQEWAVLAQEDTAWTGMYHCARWMAYVNGQPTPVGYLGGLRVAPHARHRRHAFRKGYASILQLNPFPAPSYWFSSIACDNTPARRLLEAQVPGLPRYTPLGSMHTYSLRTQSAPTPAGWQRCPPSDGPAWCATYRAHAHPISPVLTPENMHTLGATFYGHYSEGRMTACFALWNQQAYKQIRAVRYRPPLGALRPLYNVYATLTGRIPLPAPGETLPHTFMAFCGAADADWPDMIQAARTLAPTPVLTFGLPATHPAQAEILHRFNATCYRSTIYQVHLSDTDPAWSDSAPFPEVALL